MDFAAKRLSIKRELQSDHFDDRPEGSVIDTIIIHSMFNPESPYDKYSAKSCKEILDNYQVSAHYIIDRGGIVWQLVSEENRAWHAGVSQLPDGDVDRPTVNHFSVGVELVALVDTDNNHFTEEQYLALARLTSEIMTRHPIKNIYGHRHIAPGRKSDPRGFDWRRFRYELEHEVGEVKGIKFPTR